VYITVPSPPKENGESDATMVSNNPAKIVCGGDKVTDFVAHASESISHKQCFPGLSVLAKYTGSDDRGMHWSPNITDDVRDKNICQF